RSLAVRALVRAPEEEQWIAIGQALRTNAALAHWPEKANREAPRLSPAWRAAILAAQQQRAAHTVRRPVRFAFDLRKL
ncbi:MAG: hypothetical protein IKO55_11750, partial [Kiritimatiellae bacterium]|nr:hypothetical protein [Kiritimatiellia bacterium]